MSNPALRERLFRLSLREMLVLVTLAALAIVSLKYASDLWLAVIAALTMILCFVALIIAAIDRGGRQAFAIGFSLVAIGYWGIIINGARTGPDNGRIALNFSSGRLPTTVLLGRLYSAVREAHWFDPNTHEEVFGYRPDETRSLLPGRGGPPFAPAPYLSNVPKQQDFMPIGHCWWAILLGYVGGYFGRFVYLRRVQEQPASN